MRLEGLPRFITEAKPTTVSDLPLVDLETINEAVYYTDSFIEDHHYGNLSKGLQTSIALSVYNYFSSLDFYTPRFVPSQLQRQLFTLSENEKKASHKYPLIPSIGWEVELPKMPYQNLTYKEGNKLLKDYQTFFYKLGIPWNKDNPLSLIPQIKMGGTMLLEIESTPSYSAEVQARLLSELIKGNFIPSLYYSTNATDIQNELDREQLVAFHFSTTLPKTRSHDKKTFEHRLEMVEDILAIGFSSLQRLSVEDVSTWYHETKIAESIDRKELLIRDEKRMHEIRTANVYRLLKEGQLLAAAIYADSSHTELHAISLQIESVMQNLYKSYGIDRQDTTKTKKQKNNEVAQIATNADNVSALRKLTTYWGQCVKLYI